ncbi:MAG: hypothetical protein ACRET4_13020, partial [Steroidobacteraceae bacterium]
MSKTRGVPSLLASSVVGVLLAAVSLSAAPVEYNGPVRSSASSVDHVPGRFLVIWKSSAEAAKQSAVTALAKAAGTRVASSRAIT